MNNIFHPSRCPTASCGRLRPPCTRTRAGTWNNQWAAWEEQRAPSRTATGPAGRSDWPTWRPPLADFDLVAEALGHQRRLSVEWQPHQRGWASNSMKTAPARRRDDRPAARRGIEPMVTLHDFMIDWADRRSACASTRVPSGFRLASQRGAPPGAGRSGDVVVYGQRADRLCVQPVTWAAIVAGREQRAPGVQGPAGRCPAHLPWPTGRITGWKRAPGGPAMTCASCPPGPVPWTVAPAAPLDRIANRRAGTR